LSEPIPTPTLLQWIPKYQPEMWVYTDGSDIKGHRRSWAAVIYVPTCTTIYIDAGDTNETRIITQTELVAIYTALEALTGSGLGSRVKGTRDVRESYMNLVESAGNSFDPDPAWPCRRPSEGRCGCDGTIGGEIAPQPPPQVSLDTAPSYGPKNSERFKRGGGLDCQRSTAARCQVASRLAATNRYPRAAGHRYRGRLSEVVPTRANGDTSARGLFYV